MATPGFLSKRVKKKSQTGLTTDRYEFLGLDQAEPDLGDPLVGLSSVGANPAPIGGSKYVLVAAGGNTGKRYWVASSQITGSGLIPGSFTVFNNNIQVGAANSFNRFNFVGTGVTVDFVGAAVTQQTGIATVRISVTDLIGPGNVDSIPYKASSGLLAGAPDFVYSNTNIGIGSTQPTVKLDVIGNTKVLGIVTATTFVGNLTGNVTGNLTGTATTATTALGFSTTASINTSGIITATGGFVGSLTGTATTANNVSSTIDINTSGIITASSFTGNLTGTATTANNVSSTININTSGIITSTGGFVGSLTGTATTANNVSSAIDINTSGIITSTGGFVGNLTGTATTATHLEDAENITTGTIARERLTGTYDINITGSVVSSGQVLDNLTTTGLSTFTNGPVLVGSGIRTGTSKLQVSGDTFITGNIGIGTTNPTAKVHIGAATTSDPGGSPLKIGAGTTILATPEVGAIEYDGSYLYQTPNSTSGRAYVPPVYSFRRTTDGSAIGNAIADFFTTPSSLSLEASSVYKITCFAYFTKTTAGTATWTHTFSSAPTIFTSSLTYSPVTGIANGTQTNVLSYSGGQSTASMAHAATASLSTGVNHFSRFELIAVTNAATNWRLRLTQSAGTATPLAGSFYTIEKVGPSTGTFVA